MSTHQIVSSSLITLNVGPVTTVSRTSRWAHNLIVARASYKIQNLMRKHTYFECSTIWETSTTSFTPISIRFPSDSPGLSRRVSDACLTTMTRCRSRTWTCRGRCLDLNGRRSPRKVVNLRLRIQRRVNHSVITWKHWTPFLTSHEMVPSVSTVWNPRVTRMRRTCEILRSYLLRARVTNTSEPITCCETRPIVTDPRKWSSTQ